MSTMPTMYRKLAFNVVNDFEYLGIINDIYMTLIAAQHGGQQPEGTVHLDQIQNKGKINLGNAGLGSASHLCGLMFQSALQIDMTPVPYKGTAPHHRPDRRPDRPAVRPDHQHHQPDRRQKVKGLRRDHHQTPHHACAQRPAHTRRSRVGRTST